MISDHATCLRQLLHATGACLFGFADLNNIDIKEVTGFKTGICFAQLYDNKAIDSLPDDTLFYNTVSQLSMQARDMYNTVERYLTKSGYTYKRITSGLSADDLPCMSERLPFKTIGTLAGLGWIGKSTLLVTPQYGPRVRLNVLLTDGVFRTDTPCTRNDCGDCTECSDVCPVHAITGEKWSHQERDRLLNAELCNSYLRDGLEIQDRKFICGLCMKVCPFGIQ
jgi:epoxyqueuosine reductase QueG